MLNWKLTTCMAGAAMLLATCAKAHDENSKKPKAVTVEATGVTTFSGVIQDSSKAPKVLILEAGSRVDRGREHGNDSEAPKVLIIKAGERASGEAHNVMFERGQYWLGVLVSPPSPELQAQLKLPKSQGLLVESVEPKSPAEKAGIKQYDLLLKANDKPLGDLRDLMKEIETVKEGKLTFDVLRAGKHETVAATLAKRPASESLPELPAEARAWVQKFGPETNDGNWQFRIVGPGQILPGEHEPNTPGTATFKADVTIHAKSTLSDGSKVEITREGDHPAKVVITHDKDRWEATSDDLSKIPEKIRPEVKRLLTPPMGGTRFFATGEPMKMPGPGQNMMYFGAPVVGPGATIGGPGNMVIRTGPGAEKRLDEMQKQIDELKKQVKALEEKSK